MAINLTTKYASTIEKLYTHTSFLRAHCKANVEMTGAKTCRVYMLNTTPVVDYTRNGTSPSGAVRPGSRRVHRSAPALRLPAAGSAVR